MIHRPFWLKHDPDAGWTLRQPIPGRFEWTSPQGAHHTVEPPNREQLPEPRPPAGGGFSLPTDALTPIRTTGAAAPAPWAPRRNRAGYLTTPARDTADDIARRRRAQADQPPSRYDHDPDF